MSCFNLPHSRPNKATRYSYALMCTAAGMTKYCKGATSLSQKIQTKPELLNYTVYTGQPAAAAAAVADAAIQLAPPATAGQ